MLSCVVVVEFNVCGSGVEFIEEGIVTSEGGLFEL